MKPIFTGSWGIIGVGLTIGIAASTLQYLGNPPNMGISVASMERDIAGALGLHRAARAQYLRSETMGFVRGNYHSYRHLMEFLGYGKAGPAFVLAGGYPGRQLFLSEVGDIDATLFLIPRSRRKRHATRDQAGTAGDNCRIHHRSP